MSQIRRVDANKYEYDDPRRYITVKDCLSEPEVLKAYCETHPKSVCIEGYGSFGCCPEGRNRKDFIKYDLEKQHYVRADGKIIETGQTYCGRIIPSRLWKGKEYLENQIWNMDWLGHPDIIDGNLVIEAKGGLPTHQKVRTALGQLLFYKEQEQSFRLGFLFPRIWFEAENIKKDFHILGKYGITILPA